MIGGDIFNLILKACLGVKRGLGKENKKKKNVMKFPKSLY